MLGRTQKSLLNLSGSEFRNIDSLASSMKVTLSVFAKTPWIWYDLIHKLWKRPTKKDQPSSTSQRIPVGYLGKQEITRQGKTIGTNLSHLKVAEGCWERIGWALTTHSITKSFRYPKWRYWALGFPYISLTYSLYRWVPPFLVPEMFGDSTNASWKKPMPTCLVSYSRYIPLPTSSWNAWLNTCQNTWPELYQGQFHEHDAIMFRFLRVFFLWVIFFWYN